MNLFSLKIGGIKNNLDKLSSEIDSISTHEELSVVSGIKATKILDCIIGIQSAMTALESKITATSECLDGAELEVPKK